ncbi:hypothetical protein AVEN_35497-1 [Araneus ventricosus]|uniref:Uncharacterized protein n=1 Tax=Araneus ventricosus TaxID=182803 RepID=A0A4Y2AW57_ARAVE|nr:hypothetical protein AVEN_35497-1 [Araneus ventricosus]
MPCYLLIRPLAPAQSLLLGPPLKKDGQVTSPSMAHRSTLAQSDNRPPAHKPTARLTNQELPTASPVAKDTAHPEITRPA